AVALEDALRVDFAERGSVDAGAGVEQRAGRLVTWRSKTDESHAAHLAPTASARATLGSGAARRQAIEARRGGAEDLLAVALARADGVEVPHQRIEHLLVAARQSADGPIAAEH